MFICRLDVKTDIWQVRCLSWHRAWIRTSPHKSPWNASFLLFESATRYLWKQCWCTRMHRQSRKTLGSNFAITNPLRLQKPLFIATFVLAQVNLTGPDGIESTNTITCKFVTAWLDIARFICRDKIQAAFALADPVSMWRSFMARVRCLCTIFTTVTNSIHF